MINGSDWIEGRSAVLHNILLDVGVRCDPNLTVYSLVVSAAKEIRALRSELKRLKSSENP